MTKPKTPKPEVIDFCACETPDYAKDGVESFGLEPRVYLMCTCGLPVEWEAFRLSPPLPPA